MKTPRWKRWIIERFSLKPISKHVVHHRVAREPWYYGDGATLLMLVGALLITGMFMALSYAPSPEAAYSSVVDLTYRLAFGAFVRAIHYWSAGMMIVILVYHMLRHIALGGYLPPREGIWLVGVLLFFIVLTTSFIGYTLRWDERSVYAIRVALNIFHKIPWIGEYLVRFVQGGWEIGGPTLSRLYAVHVLFAPVILVVLIGYHIYLVLTFGATTHWEKKLAPETAEEQIAIRTLEKNSPEYGEDFFPFAFSKSGTVSYAVFVLVAILALVHGPQDLYPEANLTEVSAPVEEWWFHWYSALAALLPPALAHYFHWLFPIALFLFLLALPFVDHGANRDFRRRPLAVIAVAATVVALLGLSGLRMKSPWTAGPRAELPPLPQGVQLSAENERGRQLFAHYGCYNCHALGGHGSGFAPNLTGGKSRLGVNELRRFILEPPNHAAMPSYRERLSERELELLVNFVLAAQTFPKEY